MREQSKVKFLEEIFGEGYYHSKSKELLLYCPFCFHHKKKLSVNVDSDYWKCWVCEKAGKSLFSLLQKTNASESQIQEYSKTFKSKKASSDKIEKVFKPSLPTEYQPLIDFKYSAIAKRFLQYLERRMISEEVILKHKIGFCASGSYKDRVILPSFDKSGNLNFFTGRDITGISSIKYLNEKDLPKNYKSSIIINEINIDFSRPVIIVEGFFDMYKYPYNTIPLCGSSLGKDTYLFQTLVKKNCDVILALDPDVKDKTFAIAKNLLSYDLNVRYVDVSPYKDIGSMAESSVASKIDAATPVNSSFLLRSKICQLYV